MANGKVLTYKYGEFFPIEISPFAYNETVAQEYFPLEEDEAVSRGYHWKHREKRLHPTATKFTDIPDLIQDITDSILNDIIECQHKEECAEQCAGAFKITPDDLAFYRKMNLPAPRLCPNCRHYQRLKQRNPLKLWFRKCTCAGVKSENGNYVNNILHFHNTDQCPNAFQTSYAPDRPEIIYCESCYNSEVA
jgi:hypothetical protein